MDGKSLEADPEMPDAEMNDRTLESTAECEILDFGEPDVDPIEAARRLFHMYCEFKQLSHHLKGWDFN